MGQMNLSTGTETLTYSVDDRLNRYQKTGSDAYYYYDYSELRVKKAVNGERTYFIYDGAGTFPPKKIPIKMLVW